MEKWESTVLDIRATLDNLGGKCGQLPGMLAMSGCYSVSYPYGKSALNVPMINDIDGIQYVLRELAISQGQLKGTDGAFFRAIYDKKMIP